MNISVIHEFSDPSQKEFEVVERKGRAHPDTLADRLAETLSRTYSSYTMNEFGTVLRHQFDKLSLMGGKCEVRFGGGHFRSPIRLLINGRVTQTFAGTPIAFRDMLVSTAAEFLSKELANFEFFSDCRVMFEVASHTTRGITGAKGGQSAANYRFRPRSLHDLPEYVRPIANDTAVGCAWAPFTPTEAVVLELERELSRDETRAGHPWLDWDIKIMACRMRDELDITVSVPQISTQVRSGNEYFENRANISSLIEGVLGRHSFRNIRVNLTPGDDLEQELIYMRLTGSCIESGDEGQVNRGNRIGGVISSRRPFSIEGLCGKNPAYHAGKLYSAAAWDIANNIWSSQAIPCEVYIASQIDRPLDEPWIVVINTLGELDGAMAHNSVNAILTDISGLTRRILEGKYPFV